MGRAALTVDARRVLGFEDAGAWGLVQGNVSSLHLSNIRTEGAVSLAFAASGYATLRSLPLPNFGTTAFENVRLDLWLPEEQPNPYWLGALQLYIEIPSRNLWNAYVGQIELTQKTKNAWNTLEFAVPAHLLPQLNGTYGDLRFIVALNVPSDASGVYRLDNLKAGLPCPAGQAKNAAGVCRCVSFSVAASVSASGQCQNGETQFSEPVQFELPEQVHAIAGTTIGGKAYLRVIPSEGSAEIVCSYVGPTGSGDAETDLEFGTAYYFAGCSTSIAPGQELRMNALQLTLSRSPTSQGSTTAQILVSCALDEPLVDNESVPPDSELAFSEMGFPPSASPSDSIDAELEPIPDTDLAVSNPEIGGTHAEQPLGIHAVNPLSGQSLLP